MKRFEITSEELSFLIDMIKYLQEEGNSCSLQGSNQLKEVFDRISSRPVMDTVIDPQVFIDHGDYLSGKDIKDEEENQTDNKGK
jgi:hypothetical protein